MGGTAYGICLRYPSFNIALRLQRVVTGFRHTAH